MFIVTQRFLVIQTLKHAVHIIERHVSRRSIRRMN